MTVWEQVGREIEDFLSTVRTLPVSLQVSPDVVRHAVESRVDFVESIPLPDLTQLVIALLRAVRGSCDTSSLFRIIQSERVRGSDHRRHARCFVQPAVGRVVTLPCCE
jgi:hypothetical protein